MVDFPEDDAQWQEWTRRWWQAVAKIPRDRNPVLDPDGSNFMSFKQPYQKDGIFFLFGNRGGTNIRNISVPHGIAFFFPYVNYIATHGSIGTFSGLRSSPTMESRSNSLELEQEAANDISNCTADVRYSGGVTERLVNRVATPKFDIEWALPPAFGSASPKRGKSITEPGASDGIWAFTNVLNTVEEDILSIEISSSHREIFQQEEQDTNQRARRHQWNSTVTYNIRMI